MSKRSEALAQRLEKGAWALAAFAGSLTEAQWKTRVSPSDARTVGVIVHHVAWQYELEIQLAGLLAQGKPIAGVKWADVHGVNANHAKEYAGATRQEALDLLKRNSAMAAEFIRKLTDEQLDSAQPVSLNADAPLTTQFFIEDHALRHSYWHLEKIREALGQSAKVAAA
jgi:hypothetical protein